MTSWGLDQLSARRWAWPDLQAGLIHLKAIRLVLALVNLCQFGWYLWNIYYIHTHTHIYIYISWYSIKGYQEDGMVLLDVTCCQCWCSRALGELPLWHVLESSLGFIGYLWLLTWSCSISSCSWDWNKYIQETSWDAISKKVSLLQIQFSTSSLSLQHHTNNASPLSVLVCILFRHGKRDFSGLIWKGEGLEKALTRGHLGVRSEQLGRFARCKAQAQDQADPRDHDGDHHGNHHGNHHRSHHRDHHWKHHHQEDLDHGSADTGCQGWRWPEGSGQLWFQQLEWSHTGWLGMFGNGWEWLGVAGNAWGYDYGPVEEKYDETWVVCLFFPLWIASMQQWIYTWWHMWPLPIQTLHCPDPTHEIQKGVLYIYIAQKEVAK